MGSTDTFSGWPRLFSPDDAPVPFRAALARLSEAQPGPPTCIYNPEHRFDRYLSSAKVVAWWSDRLALLDAAASGTVTAELTLAQVSRIEWGTALLSTWLELEGAGPRGRATARVDFNTTCRFLYDPLLALLRGPRYPGAHPGWTTPPFDELTRLDYRFASFARMALAPGADALAWHREPALRLRRPRSIWWERLPAFLVLLTQAELVLVLEGDGRRHGPYAATWTFLPLAELASATVEVSPAQDRARLRLRLRDGGEAGCEASAASAPAIRAVLSQLPARRVTAA